MVKEAAERYMEWLVRKEEEVGVGAVERATMEVETFKGLFFAQMGYLPQESQIRGFMEMGKARYEVLPGIGIASYWVPHPGGRHLSYYSFERKRFMPYTEVSLRLKSVWAEWGY